jgi:2,4-dienoyl-CoA reductase-like NADH-dependent reductase (Old Yellow Enzyme family)
MVSDKYHGGGADVSVPSLHPGNHTEAAALRQVWRDWAAACQKHGTPAVVQLNHPGRQNLPGSGQRGFWEKTVSASPVPLNLGDGILPRLLSACFLGSPRELTVDEIEGPGGIIEQFVEGAKVSFDSGFKGVEIHAAYVLLHPHEE